MKEKIIIVPEYSRVPDTLDRLYVIYRIGNQEIKEVSYHCVELQIKKGKTLSETVEEYLPIAKQEVLNVVNEFYPDLYE